MADEALTARRLTNDDLAKLMDSGRIAVVDNDVARVPCAVGQLGNACFTGDIAH